MRKAVLLANTLLLSIALVAVALPAFANVAAMKIDGVTFEGTDPDQTMVILGKQFDTAEGEPPTVTIEGEGNLVVIGWDNSSIETELPSGLVGDYTLSVSTGAGKKRNADFALVNLAGTMHVVCVDWYLTTKHESHIHAEAFVQDQLGRPVIGAAVNMINTVDTGVGDPIQWQDKTSVTFKYAGYSHGESCPLSVAKESGATGQFCCIGLGPQEPFCPSGTYEATVISVDPPAGSNAVWDGIQPDPRSRDFDNLKP